MRCQWKYASGCPFYEFVTRRYFKEMEPIITRCMMVLPPEALTEPLPVTNEGKRKPVILLPTGSEERGVLWVGSIPGAILPSCHNMKPNRYNCINMNIVG